MHPAPLKNADFSHEKPMRTLHLMHFGISLAGYFGTRIN
jgi:hypothetical protein